LSKNKVSILINKILILELKFYKRFIDHFLKPPTNMIRNIVIAKFIFDSLKTFKIYIALHLFVITFNALNISLWPYISKILLNKIISTKSDQIIFELAPIIISLSCLTILPSLVYRITDYSWTMLIPALRKKITNEATSKTIKQSHHFFQNNFSGLLVNKVRDLFNSTPKIIEIFLYNFLGSFLAILIAFVTLVSVNYFFALGLIIWVVFLITIGYRSATITNRVSLNIANQQGKIMGNIVDIFSNIQNIKLFASSAFEVKRLNNLQNKYSLLYKKRGFILNKFYISSGLISSCYFIACFIFLVWLYSKNKITVGDFILIFTINNFLHNLIQDSIKQIRNFLEEVSVVRNALEVIQKPISIKDHKKDLVVSKGEIIFDRVKFSYDRSTPLFSDKSIIIKPNQKVGLVGHSGSGKSTFVNLLLRFYDVNDGRIIIDGQDISKISQDSLHENIGVIPQDPSLFHRTIFENIAYGACEISDFNKHKQKIIDAAKKSHIHKSIELMPNGYNSMVGERGIKLSGGQRQRIAIARAFFKDAPILILDEATSQLDSLTENMIQESLKNLMKNKTTLVIAHRLSTLQMMDRIIVFSGGKIVEDGTHDELIDLNGVYKRLWSAQIGGILTYQVENAEVRPLWNNPISNS